MIADQAIMLSRVLGDLDVGVCGRKLELKIGLPLDDRYSNQKSCPGFLLRREALN
jgi:hypothetical protein